MKNDDGTGIGDVIFNIRSGIDNMSARLLNRNMPEEIANILNNQIGTYMTTEYRMHVNMGLLSQYKPTAQDLMKAKQVRLDQLIKDPKNINRTKESLKVQADKDVARYVKSKSLDEIPLDKMRAKNGDVDQVVSPVTKTEIESVSINPNILKPKQLKEQTNIYTG